MSTFYVIGFDICFQVYGTILKQGGETEFEQMLKVKLTTIIIVMFIIIIIIIQINGQKYQHCVTILRYSCPC